MKQGRKTRAKRTVDQTARAEVVAVVGGRPYRRDRLIEYLHRLQDHYGCVSKRQLRALADETGLPMSEVFETVSFYHHFDVVGDNEQRPPPLTVRVCDSMTCEMFGCRSLIRQLEESCDEAVVRIQPVPCVGRCETAPVAVVGTNPIGHADLGRVLDAIKNGDTRASAPPTIDYRRYREGGGYDTLRRCHDGALQRDTVIDMLQDASLRGLGGAGFPVGKKWRILTEQPAPRLIAINIDEGEPGTFKDRYFLERDPHRFIEGTLIAHWAIQAQDVYLYLRDEYAGCRELLEAELEALRAQPPCDLPNIELRRGAGAYVCGEESAMIESIEGKRGIPRLRPPYVAQVGLFGQPTLEHNMESMHWVRDIIERGPAWFSDQGRNGRCGMRSYSVSGRVTKPGVHLAPAGITVRELIEEHCGGMLPGHEFYGYFPGGASGGILPAELGDLPLDFDTLQPYGCFIGSAAIVVFSDQDSARALALNAMRFFEHESCGQCTPCRVGTGKAAQLMEEERWDRTLLEELSRVMEDASICGLGQAAPNPIRCVLKYFPGEVS